MGLRFRDKTNGNCGIKLVLVPINSFRKSVGSFHFVPPLVHSPREFIWTLTSDSPMAPPIIPSSYDMWGLLFFFGSQNDNKTEQRIASIMSLIRGSIQKNLCFFKQKNYANENMKSAT